MAVTGFWYARSADDDEVEALRESIDSFAGRVEADRGVQEVMAAWRGWPGRVHGLDREGRLDRLNRLFLGAFLAAHPGENTFYACSRDDIDSTTWDVGREHAPSRCEAVFAHTERFPPMSLLFVGLGPERSARLPGAMGNFALTAGELDRHADRIRHAHALAPAERADAIKRMNGWLEVGSAPGFSTGQVLEALPAVIGPALNAGKGLVSVTVAM